MRKDGVQTIEELVKAVGGDYIEVMLHGGPGLMCCNQAI